MTRRGPKAPPNVQRFGAKMLTLAIAVGCIALQAGREVHLAGAALVIWLVTLFIADRGALARLRMPKFWTITIALALGSGLLLGERDLELGPIWLSARGLEAGALMILRGAFVFALASWAQRAASGGPIHRLADRVGLGNMSLAVASAFGVLPAIRDGLAEGRKGRSAWTRLRSVASDALYEAALLAERLGRDSPDPPHAVFAAIVAPRGTGKTTAARRVVEELRELGLEVGGVVQPAIEGEEQRTGYDLEDLRTGSREPLARRGEERFHFHQSAWVWAAERIKTAQKECDVVVLDEVGRLEARGEGHLPAVASLAHVPGRAAVLLAAIRQECLPPVEDQLGEVALRFSAPMDQAEAALAAQQIADAAKHAALEAGDHQGEQR